MKEAKSLKQEVSNFKEEVKRLKYQQTINEKFKEKLQDSKRLEEEVILLRNKLDKEYIKSKFENTSRNLDEILSSQRPSSDKTGLGYDKENKPECFSFTFQDTNKRNYAAVFESQIKKDSQKYAPSSHNKDRTDMIPKE